MSHLYALESDLRELKLTRLVMYSRHLVLYKLIGNKKIDGNKEIDMRRRFTWILPVIVLCTNGCTYNVAFQKPEDYVYKEKIPANVCFYMPAWLKSRQYDRSIGFTDEWIVPYGEVTYQYAQAYLFPVFQRITELESEAYKYADNFLIRIDDIQYSVEWQSASGVLDVTVISPSGKEVLKKRYSETGPMMLRGYFGTKYAQSSVIRNSTHVVYENIFMALVSDFKNGFEEWTR